MSGENPYDAIPYRGAAHTETHPDNLGTLAGLMGLDPAPPSSARILEIGCAMGLNLLPLADQLPGAQLVGVDRSASEIAVARRLAAGLPNVQLLAADIADPQLARSLGEFDYILCHGVYSWVAPEVQQAILRVCRKHLAPHGVAFVSYNALPGWHSMSAVRDLMRFHARGFAEPQEQVRQARAALTFVRQSLEGHEGVYPSLIRKMHQALLHATDEYIFHEYLSPYNEPLYLEQFVERAAGHGLQLLTDAEFPATCIDRWPPEVAARLRELGQDLVGTEQYLDFLRDRRFRRTLLCHAERDLERALRPERLRGRRVRMEVRVEELSPALDGSEARFRVGEVPLIARDAVMKAALVALGQAWPEPVGFSEWVDAARTTARATSPRAEDEQDLGNTLLTCAWRGLAELRWEPGRWATAPPERPRLSPLNRRMCQELGVVVALDHEALVLKSPVRRFWADRMEGELDPEGLVQAAATAIALGALQEPDVPEADVEGWLRAELADLLQVLLTRRLFPR